MIKIIIDGRPIRSPVAGVATYVLGLVNALCQFEDFEITIAYDPDRACSLSLDRLPNSIKFFPIASGGFTRLAGEFGWSFDVEKYDLVFETYFARLPMRASKRLAMIHDVIPLDNPRWFSLKEVLISYYAFYRQTLYCDVVVSPSDFTAKRINIFNPFVKKRSISVIPIGVEYNQSMTDMAPDRDTNKSSNQYIVGIGTVEPRKNYEMVCEAVRRINAGRAQQSRISFLVLGGFKKTEEKYIRELREAYPETIFLGFVSEQEKWAYLKDAQCFISSSQYEGFGIPIIEAIRYDIPVLVRNNSSQKELVGSLNCFGGVSDLHVKLLDLLSRPEKYLVKKSARYEWENVGKAYRRLILEIL